MEEAEQWLEKEAAKQATLQDTEPPSLTSEAITARARSIEAVHARLKAIKKPKPAPAPKAKSAPGDDKADSSGKTEGEEKAEGEGKAGKSKGDEEGNAEGSASSEGGAHLSYCSAAVMFCMLRAGLSCVLDYGVPC